MFSDVMLVYLPPTLFADLRDICAVSREKIDAAWTARMGTLDIKLLSRKHFQWSVPLVVKLFNAKTVMDVGTTHVGHEEGRVWCDFEDFAGADCAVSFPDSGVGTLACRRMHPGVVMKSYVSLEEGHEMLCNLIKSALRCCYTLGRACQISSGTRGIRQSSRRTARTRHTWPLKRSCKQSIALQ